MTKSVLNILFSSFLLSQTIAVAEETFVEEKEIQEINITEKAMPEQEESRATESKDGLSEAQKEALAAEEAELREAGMYEEEAVEE